MIGHLLDLEFARLIRFDDENAVDLQETRDLGVDEIVIRAHRQGGVREAGDDQRMRPLSSDCAVRDHALRVCHLPRDDDGSV